MRWQRHDLVGRRAELDALRRHSEVPALLVVRGPEGSGRTALLRKFRAESGAVVLDLGGGDSGPAWDEFRARALLGAVRTGFEALGGGPRVAESIEAVSRLCVPESYATPGRRHQLLGAISTLLTRIRVRLVIVVDDADEVPVSALVSLYRGGHTVVAACGTGASRELCSLADLVVDLVPLTEDEIGRLLWQVAAAPVDDAVPRALRENLGPLYGNAGTLVSTVESLWDQGRLGKVHGVLALRAPRAPIALPAGHRLLAEIDAHARVVVRLASAEAGFRVDRIPALAESTGHAAHDYGHAVDRLVRAGVLAHEAGRLRCRARAVGAAFAASSAGDPDDREELAAYHRVCCGYADGDWADALSAARELEFMSDAPTVDVARLLAAEICGWRGADRQAASWLAAVGADTRFPGLRGWVATGLREQDAFTYGWDWYTTHADRLEEPGVARLLTRLASIATDAGDRYRARVVLRETQDRYGPASETGLLVRGIVEGDDACVRAAERVIRERGTRFELAFACERLARLSGEPQRWLSEAYELARSIGAAKLVSTTRRAMAGCGVAVPVRRPRQADVSDVERQIVELIRLGRTNRQIALALRVSAKTVEKHLTRLFAKAGCRTRHGLATSGLGTWHELVGA